MGDLLGAKVLKAGELQLIAVSDEINYLKGTAATVLTKPDGKDVLVLDSEVGTFRAKLGDLSVLGSELITDGTFTLGTAFTEGTGWSQAAGIASSDGSQSADSDLEQVQAGALVAEGEYYDVSFTVSNYSAGNVTPVVGGVEGTDRGANGTHNEIIRASSSQVLALRADSTFVGDIDTFIVKKAVMEYTAPLTQTGGSGSLKIRTDVPIAISAPSTITVVGSDAADILAYYWL